MSDEERKQARITQKELQAVLLSTPSRNQMDPTYRRILHIRYADDFLIGIIGNRSDAEQVKTDVSHFFETGVKPYHVPGENTDYAWTR